MTVLVIFLSFTTSVALANDAVTKFKCYGTPVIIYNSNVVEYPFLVLTIESPGRTSTVPKVL